MSEKIDLEKTYKRLYAPSAKAPEMVDVPPFNFLMLDGCGNPNTTPQYQDTVTTLFQTAYALKFHIKKSQGIDYGVMPLEGLWWIEDELEFTLENKDRWSWTMMILQPEWVTVEMIEQICRDLSKKKDAPPRLAEMRFENYAEGTSVQLMHIGPYVDEHPNIMRMHSYAHDQGYANQGKHHEIYISDVRKTAPERLKTVLRQPVRKNSAG